MSHNVRARPQSKPMTVRMCDESSVSSISKRAEARHLLTNDRVVPRHTHFLSFLAMIVVLGGPPIRGQS